MKMNFKYLCIIASISIFIQNSAFSQSYPTDKGSKIIGGRVSFTHRGGDLFENSDGDKRTAFQMDPFACYFISPGLALGAGFIFEKQSQGDYNAMAWGLGPKLKYFFGHNQSSSPVKGSNYPFLAAQFIFLNYSVDYGSGDEDTSGNRLDLSGGILHMLSESVGLTGSATYSIQNQKHEKEDSKSGNSITLSAGLSFFLY